MDEILPGRRLLGTSLPKEHSINMVSGILLGGVAAVMMLVFLFALCTCKDSKKEQGRSGNAPKSMNENRSDVVRSIIESEHMTVDFETGIIPLSNGIPAVNSRTSDLFNSSRPTSIDGSGLPNGRQLPSPPGKLNINPLPDVAMVDHPSNGYLTNSRISCHVPCQEDEEDEDDPYDHLGQRKLPGANDDDDDEDDAYDHVGKPSNIVKKSGCITITQADFNNYGSEQLYASVDGEDDNTYASLKISGKKRPPVSSVISPSESTAFRDVSYSIVPGEDLDDPYSKISGESASTKPDVEDPYASVDTSRNGSAAAAVAAPASILVPEPTSSLCASPVDGQPRIIEDDYAIVNKPRRSTSPVNLPVIEPLENIDLQLPPPEPPRAYIDEDLESNNSSPEENLGGAVGGGLPAEAVLQPVKVEPPYTKVTARESLASINARQRLLNMYETVPETENMYATVDGGSGDGVVVRRTNRPENPPKRSSQVSETYAEIGATGGHAESVPVPPSLDSLRTVTKQNPHGGDFRRSGGDFIPVIAEIQHDYAVVNKRRTFPIDFSQAHYDVPSSRNMPQLAMSAQRGLILIDPSEQPPPTSTSTLNRRPKSPKKPNNCMTQSLTNKLPDCSMPIISPSSSKETPSTSSRSSIVTSPKLEPEYQVMRDGGGSENDSEYDPNYETVEDAQRKAAAHRQNKARRRHDYEEVDASQLQNPASPPANPTEEARERVLRQHTYEDVREVRKQHKTFRCSQEQ